MDFEVSSFHRIEMILLRLKKKSIGACIEKNYRVFHGKTYGRLYVLSSQQIFAFVNSRVKKVVLRLCRNMPICKKNVTSTHIRIHLNTQSTPILA
jgi:hypothetical protein